MKSKSSNTMKYVGAAMAVGGTVMLGSAMVSNAGSMKKKVKKTATKALDVLDTAITNVQNIVK